MGELEDIAYRTLGNIGVEIGEPSNFPGSEWEVGEQAWISITLRNNTGSILRDVVATIRVEGAAKFKYSIRGMSFWPHGNEWVQSADWLPGQIIFGLVRVEGTYAGTAHIAVDIAAEVVPAADRTASWRNFPVEPT